jgi:hypothetical protein
LFAEFCAVRPLNTTSAVKDSGDCVRLGSSIEGVPGSHLQFTCDFFGLRATVVRHWGCTHGRIKRPLVKQPCKTLLQLLMLPAILSNQPIEYRGFESLLRCIHWKRGARPLFQWIWRREGFETSMFSLIFNSLQSNPVQIVSNGT